MPVYTRKVDCGFNSFSRPSSWTSDILLLVMYALKNQDNRLLENMRLKLSMRLKVSCA